MLPTADDVVNLDMLRRIAHRLENAAHDLQMRSRVDVHYQNGLIGQLRTEAALILIAIGDKDMPS
jgi:hypothetical protein